MRLTTKIKLTEKMKLMKKMKSRKLMKTMKVMKMHYHINGFPQRHSGAFPDDLSLGIPFPGDLSPGKRRWGRLVRDPFPGDNPRRKDMVMKGANNGVNGNDNIDDGDDKKQQKKLLIELNEIVTEDQH
nr:hypothetical protein [Tanacetum cinerariifolium]